MSRQTNRLLARVLGKIPAAARLWTSRLERESGEIGWTEPRKPLREAALAVITTGGVHLETQPPFDMADPQGDPSYRVLPAGASPDALTITHDYYDHRDAEEDLNLVLPLGRLQELVDRGVVGALHPEAFSFMGHIDGPHLRTLRERTAPEVAARLAAAKVDYALLVPA